MLAPRRSGVQRPHLNETLCDRTGGLGNEGDDVLDGGGFDNREPGERKVGAQKRTVGGVYTRSVVIAHLHGLAGDAHQRSSLEQALVHP